jgi:hypothetical protein
MSTSPRWSRPAINALHMLYRAGWRWAAISTHVSAVDGHPRSTYACRQKADSCGMLDSSRIYGAALAVPDYDADIADMMVMDYSLQRMADELSRQHGRRIMVGFIYKRMTKMGQTYTAWRKRAGARRSRGQTGINRKGQGRAAA